MSQDQVFRNQSVGSRSSEACSRAAVGDADADQDVVAVSLGVLDEDIEVAVFIEHAGVHQFVFGLVLAAPSVLLQQQRIGKFLLRILVEILHVRVRRRAVEIEVVLLDVFAVITFASSQAKQPLFEYRIPAVPQRQRRNRSIDGDREMPAMPSSFQR